MNEGQQHITYLWQRFADKTASDSEIQELFDYLENAENEAAVLSLLDEYFYEPVQPGSFDREFWLSKLKEIIPDSQIPVVSLENKVKNSVWQRIAVAASVLLVFGLGSYFVFFNKPDKQSEIVKKQETMFKNDVNAGEYKARLTLADGRTIILDSVVNGELAMQGGTVVTNKDGQLVYSRESGAVSREVIYNTLTTARGEMYATVLADGSKVWLNSASSIKYPVAFTGRERRVEITGEAYFEVTHNEKMPFIVLVNGMEVHDLGTEFNVNAYNDEALVKTTLVQGSAKVVKGRNNQLLLPGQQAQLNKTGEIKLISDADVATAVAWKNGIFRFSNDNIEVIMRQISRWYDVDIVYEGNVKELGFAGVVPRKENISAVLKFLELTGVVKFEVEGRKVVVKK